MKCFIIVVLTIVIVGCAQNGYQQSYLSYVEDPYFEQKAVNENPLIISSQNIRHDIKTLNANRYVVIGYSSFEGKLESIESIQEQAKRVGATVVLADIKTLSDKPSSRTSFIEGSATSFETGSRYRGSTIAVPVRSEKQQYSQVAYFLAKAD